MRTAFFQSLMEAAEMDDRIALVVGDLGFGVVEPFAQRFPKRFLNAGVAEQNMMGLATGLALMGKIVFTYSIANFPTLRCLEQIRNDICYHKVPVKIVALGGGFAYGALGMTHHATEDLAVFRALPEMTVVAPGDPVEAACATRAVAAHAGPCYLRIGRAGEPSVHRSKISFELGKALCLREGQDLTVISTGGILQVADQAVELLARQRIGVRLLSMHTVKPLDKEAVLAAANETSAVLTLEEHSLVGGLGSAVASVLAEQSGRHVPFKQIGVPSEFSPVAGSQEYLRAKYGLTPEAVAQTAEKMLCSSDVRRAPSAALKTPLVGTAAGSFAE